MNQTDQGNGIAEKGYGFLGRDQDMITELDKGTGRTVRDKDLFYILAAAVFNVVFISLAWVKSIPLCMALML